jgi:hypothetical protein
MLNFRGLPLIAIVLISGCTQHTWGPGPAATKPLGVASGECKLVALSAGSGGGYVVASGSPQFVGTAVGSAQIGAGIGATIRQQNIYNACMEAQGFVAIDQPGAGPPQVVAQPLASPPGPLDTDETIIARARETCASMDPTLGAFYTRCVAERSPRSGHGWAWKLFAADRKPRLAVPTDKRPPLIRLILERPAERLGFSGARVASPAPSRRSGGNGGARPIAGLHRGEGCRDAGRRVQLVEDRLPGAYPY